MIPQECDRYYLMCIPLPTQCRTPLTRSLTNTRVSSYTANRHATRVMTPGDVNYHRTGRKGTSAHGNTRQVLGPTKNRPDTSSLAGHMHYEVSGSSLFKQTVCFIHGLCCDLTDWEHQRTHFQDRYRVIGCDLKGHGYSAVSVEPVSIENWAADIA